MKNIFTEHPQRINETYFQHLKFAFLFGANMLIGGMACLLHAFFPFVFEKTGSQFLIKMMHQFIQRMPVIADKDILMIADLIKQKLPRETGMINKKE